MNSHRIVDCEECRLQPEEFNRAMGAFREWAAAYGDPVYDEATHSGRMRRLYLRKGEMTGQIWPVWWSTAMGCTTKQSWYRP